MKNYILIFILFVISCTSDNQFRKINLAFGIDDEKLNTIEELVIKYKIDSLLDTVYLISNNNVIKIPKYDSSMQYFSIKWGDYNFDFNGKFLEYELPPIVDKDVDIWYLRIDTPPFDEDRYNSRDDISAIFQITAGSERLKGVSTTILNN